MIKMEFECIWSILASLLGTFVVLFGFLRRVNECYYCIRLDLEKRCSLPPGDMCWPLLGNMLSFFQAYKARNPEDFINNLVNRYGPTGVYKTHHFGSPSIIVCTQETCRRVLIKGEQFGLGYPECSKQITGRRSFHSISNTEHKRLRKLITGPVIGHEALSMFIGVMKSGDNLWLE